MRWIALLGVLCTGCSEEPSELQSLQDTSIFLDIQDEPTDPTIAPFAFAAYRFSQPGMGCPAPTSLSADLDGTPFPPLRNVGSIEPIGPVCGFGATIPPLTPSTAQSTLRFSDGTSTAALVANLQRRTLTSELPAGSAVHPGDAINFVWSVDTDQTIVANAYFENGSGGGGYAVVQPTGARLQVIVPPALVSGNWTVHVKGTAQPEIVSCVGANRCGCRVDSQTLTLAVTIP